MKKKKRSTNITDTDNTTASTEIKRERGNREENDTDGNEDTSKTMTKEGEGLVAFVPTMGFLHEGHLALVDEAKKYASHVVVSIYVNPSQFAPGEDFDEYPRSLESDLKKLEQRGCVSAVFLPQDLYNHRKEEKTNVPHSSSPPPPDSHHQTWVSVRDLEVPLCGVTRPHFFRGVATVVTKLFHIVEPDLAVFGRKDFQQLRVIETLVKELDFPIAVVSVPIVREQDGLAMSSRNARLTERQRRDATCIYRALNAAKQMLMDVDHEMDMHKHMKNTTTNNNPKKIKRDDGTQTGTQTGQEGGLSDVVKGFISDAILRGRGRVDYVEVVNANTLQPLSAKEEEHFLCLLKKKEKKKEKTEPATTTTTTTSSSRSKLPSSGSGCCCCVLIAVAAFFGNVRLIDNVTVTVTV